MKELTKAITHQELRGPVARLAHVDALNFGAEHGIVQDRAPLEQIVLLEHVADLAARTRDRLAVEQDRAIGGVQNS